MSAYLVDRHHVAFLVAVAFSQRNGSAESSVSYYLKDNVAALRKDRTLRNASDRDLGRIALARELARQNIASIEFRYPDCKGHPDNAPGDQSLYDHWTLDELDDYLWPTIGSIAVIKACHCYSYQSCEDDGWEASTAKRCVSAIESHAINQLPGYDAAPWGAPLPARAPTAKSA